MRIEYLKDHTHVIRELAELHLEYFGLFNPKMTVESRMDQLHARLGTDSIPLTVVALEKEKVIGSACLVHNDMKTHPELAPWVASVFVRTEYRRRGVGTVLMNRLDAEAYCLGVHKLYLFTPDMQVFYSGLGWRSMGTEMYRGNEVTIMEKVIDE